MILLRWLLSSLAVILTAYLVPDVRVSGLWAALLAALVIGLINALIRPLILLLTLPINLLTLGLFTLVINALMFWFASSIVKGFDVQNFTAAFFGALAYAILSWMIQSLFKER